jgi:hypothetical protein
MRSWPEIVIDINRGEVRLIGCLGHEIGYADGLDVSDLASIRRVARWLGLPAADLYDFVLQARQDVAA